MGGGVSLPSESAEGPFAGGTGTADDPYQIATADDLREFAKLVNGTDGNSADPGAHAKLMNNIDLNGSEENPWTPIGNSINQYIGTFDGNGHTISGLYIDSNADGQGLFGYVSGSGTVQNLSVSGSVSVSGNRYVGGVVGLNLGTVINCAFSGSVSGSDHVGGVVGYNGDIGSVKNCYNIGKVTGSAASSNVGGVVGYNDEGPAGRVENCYNTGEVSGGEEVGGVVGDNRGTVKNSYNTGAVSGVEEVGGVVGNNYNGSVENSYNTGAVSGVEGVGGVVGQNGGGTVENCYNTGTVTGTGTDDYVGGVVGWNVSGGTVTGCYFLQTTGVNESLQGIGRDDSATSATAAAVKDLSELCKKFENDPWTTSPFYKHPVLKTNPEGGDGTKEHPYEIKTAAQLETFRDLVNDEGGNPNAHAKLMNDIDLNGNATNQWTPIGNSIGNSYEGTFNGDGHTISGLYIGTTANNQGLFGYLSTDGDNTGTVQNLTVSGNVSGGGHVGGVVGYNNGGTVTGCTFSVSGTVSGNRYVGGVVGYNGGNVENCYNTGSVTGVTVVSVSSDYVGGVVGDNGGTVENCYNTGSVKGDWYVGGVVGSNGSNGSIEKCHNTGKVSGNRYVGGVVGGNDSGTVENCYNTRTVGGNNFVGGVVGGNGGSVKNCYNTGEVTGSSDYSYIGGVVGGNISSGNVKNCYNIGSVTATGIDGRVGGVVGYNDSSASVANCYNTGTVSDGTTSGGVVGQNFGSGSVTNCYFLPTADVNENLSGIGSGTGTATEKDDTAFHSGEVAHLLGEAWGQSALGTDNSWPTLVALDNSAKTVYKVTVDYNYDGAQNKTTYTNDPAKPAAPAREGYTFGGWDKTGEGTTTITYTAKWTENAPDPDPEPTPEPEPEEPPYSGKYSYELSTSVGDHGSLTVDRYATEGDKVTIDVTPDQAYKLDDLSVTANGKDVELTANSDGTYTFTMPSADVKITATFAEDPDWTEPEEPVTDVSDLFIDIAPDAWYKDAVQYAYDNGLMTGVSATEFAPEATTTRAMIVSILARLENVTTAQAAGFADVNDEWYATAVNWAANVGVVNGYEDNTFRPNTAITREQLAAILRNYAAYKGEDVSTNGSLANYSDAASISTWAEDSMQWAVGENLISGVTNDTLAPQAHATRAQVAAIFQRFLSE